MPGLIREERKEEMAMRFAHIADVHLGKRNETPELYDGFLNFLDYLEINPVDMIFITGDLFDHVPSADIADLICHLIRNLHRFQLNLRILHGRLQIRIEILNYGLPVDRTVSDTV